MGMRIETAIRNLSMYDVNESGNAELHTWYKDIDKDMKDSLNVAMDTMLKYKEIFDKFEILTASFEDSDVPPEVRSKKVDEFCIDTMRGILGDYYAERILEDGNAD